jgi:dipeptidyl aminopeptidase/acylaminoacyl peptidase
VAYAVDQREIWVVSLADEAPVRRVDDGSADFCFDPVIGPDRVVTWQAWNVPDMAWDGARLQRRSLDDPSAPVAEIRAAGAIQQPRVSSDGALWCVRDDTGWSNVWRNGRVMLDEAFEHADPTWGYGQRSFTPSPDGTLVAIARNEAGFGRLIVVDTSTGHVREVGKGVHTQLSWQGSRLAAWRSGAKTPSQIVVHDTTTWARQVVAVGPLSGWEQAPLVEPELLEITARDGVTLHARVYRAERPDRLFCWIHGGPTDQWQVSFMPRIAYWRAAGWTILVPDHRGSSGHGREYQQALRGRWGELDVSDTVDAIAHAHARGLGTPGSTVVLGGSAGGFTALGVAAAAPQLVAAAVVSYPVTDLYDLGLRSHRFERHYTDTLVGPAPDHPSAPGPLRDRSPVHFAERIGVPVLIMHGDEDPVVPVDQSRELAARMATAGGIVELCVYEGEGHGFRQPDHQLDEYRRIGRFLADHVPAAAPWG